MMLANRLQRLSFIGEQCKKRPILIFPKGRNAPHSVFSVFYLLPHSGYLFVTTVQRNFSMPRSGYLCNCTNQPEHQKKAFGNATWFQRFVPMKKHCSRSAEQVARTAHRIVYYLDVTNILPLRGIKAVAQNMPW